MQIKRQMQPRWKKKLSASLVGFSVDQTATSARVAAEVLLGKGADGGESVFDYPAWMVFQQEAACVPGARLESARPVGGHDSLGFPLGFCTGEF